MPGFNKSLAGLLFSELETMKIKDLNIGVRLGAAFAVILAMMVIMLGTALWQLKHITDAKEEMATATEKAKLAQEMRAGIITNAVSTVAKIRAIDPADEQSYEEGMKAISKRAGELQKIFEQVIVAPGGKVLLTALIEQRAKYSAARNQAYKMKTELGAGNPELLADRKSVV